MKSPPKSPPKKVKKVVDNVEVAIGPTTTLKIDEVESEEESEAEAVVVLKKMSRKRSW
jgi:tartrate dehydratase beta subunit/fumarate hydratase class I family protein